MKVSLEWLRQYVDYNGSVERLEELLTSIGLPVEERRQVGDDWMLDVEVTSNRGDCLGHIGLAREIAAAANVAFKMPQIEFSEAGKSVNEWAVVENQAQRFCGRYTARVIDGVRVGPSPEWMRRRLETIELRSINNVVDITNYVLMEIGQPLHAFDYEKLTGGRIVVRTAKKDEEIETIDHVRQKLTPDMLVIADAEKAVALAGIMGGLGSEVGDATKTILLESAHFDPLNTRRSSRALTLSSESSFRFERNVDVNMVEWASRRAAGLLAQLAGGQVAPSAIDLWSLKRTGSEVPMRLSRLRGLVGISFEPGYITGILARLGFEPRYDGSDNIVCKVPSWRMNDVSREVDIIEEIVRIHGFDKIPTEHKIHITVKMPDTYQRSRGTIAKVLNGSGFFEAMTVGFIEDQHQRLFGRADSEPVRVKDMVRKSNNALRESLLPSLLAVRQRNQAADNGRCDLYELAAVYKLVPGNPAPQEKIVLGLLSDGDFRELRGVIETLISRLDRQGTVAIEPTGEIVWAAPATGAAILVNDKIVGHIGLANERIMAAFDLKEKVVLAELDFEPLSRLQGGTVQLQELIRFPGIVRDLSLVLADTISWKDIEQTIQQAAKNFADDLRAISFVDIYRGKGIPAGQKSLTLSMEFRSGQETLTHEQVDKYQKKIVAALADKFQAQLRN